MQNLSEQLFPGMNMNNLTIFLRTYAFLESVLTIVELKVHI